MLNSRNFFVISSFQIVSDELDLSILIVNLSVSDFFLILIYKFKKRKITDIFQNQINVSDNQVSVLIEEISNELFSLVDNEFLSNYLGYKY